MHVHHARAHVHLISGCMHRRAPAAASRSVTGVSSTARQLRAAIAATGRAGGSPTVLCSRLVNTRAVSRCSALSGCMELVARCSLCISKHTRCS